MRATMSTDNARWTANPGRIPSKRVCPVAQAPLSDCYCYEWTNVNAMFASRICIGRYAECPIYREVTSQKGPALAAMKYADETSVMTIETW